MVNSDLPIQVYCTRPDCRSPINYIPQTLLTYGHIPQLSCNCCQMPLILIGHFLPIRLIGNGGFGRTFLAMDLNSPRRRECIIKQLHPLIPPRTPSELQRIETLFKREARVLNELIHHQIPRGLGFRVEIVPAYPQHQSSGTFNNQQTFFYLAQEYIEGQNLAQELNQRGNFSEPQVIEFLNQILNVLDYIHTTPTPSNEGIIHRDIKPHNIILRHSDNMFFLIDFGAVKQIVVAGVPSESSCVLGTRFYAPPEQLHQEAVSPCSDLYSLAATCVCLLTGRPVEELRRNNDTWIWREYANLSNTNRLADILDMMLSPEPIDRPQSAQEVIQALDFPPLEPTQRSCEPVPPPPIPVSTDSQEQQASPVRRRSRARYAFLAMLAVVFAFAIDMIFFSPHSFESQFGNGISLGEKVLIENNYENNKLGTEAFKKSQYKDAISYFIESLNKNSNDPEALIYLNNAIAALNGNPIKIATSVPIKFTNKNDLGKETLRGVAQALSEYNCDSISNFKEIVNAILKNKNAIDEQIKSCTGDQGKLLQVAIADESKENSGNDNIKNAKDVASKLINDSNILGVIGHSGSSTTAAAAEVYNDKLVLISPDSTVVRKDIEKKERLPYKLSQYTYLFRTSPTDAIAADNLVNYINDFIDKKNQTDLKVAIVIDSKDEYNYSNSFRNEFEHKLKQNQKIVKILRNSNMPLPRCNLSSTPSDSVCDINDFDRKIKPDVILLAFDLDTVDKYGYFIFCIN